MPHNLISAQETPVPLPKFQMAPRFKILISSGSKKGTQIYFFSLKNPGKRTLLPGPLWRKTTLYRAFCISLKNLIKIPLNKKAVRKKYPSISPKAGPLWKQMPILEPYLTYLSGLPVKEPSLTVSFVESLAEGCPAPRALLHSSFKVPGIRAPTPDSRFRSVLKGPLWKVYIHVVEIPNLHFP